MACKTPRPLAVPMRGRCWRGGVASGLVHALVLVIAACWMSPLLPRASRPRLESAWSPAPAEVDNFSENETPLTMELGREAIDATLAAIPVTQLWTESTGCFTYSPELPHPIDLPFVPPRQRSTRRADVTAGGGKVSVASAVGTAGAGDQPGFFGLKPTDRSRIVFVVDRSRSMNHPHDSPAKTRYRRLKMELVKCILEMDSGQSFFVVFFGDETTPMPAAQLQAAAPGIRDPYLQWIAQLPSGGAPTNPLPALDYGLRLRPDVIYFLTDGDFDGRIKRRLSTLSQRETAIHTFAFGAEDAAETLQTLAKNNRGEYRFVP